MATMSEEKKMSNAMQRCMDRLSFNPALVVVDYMRRNENMQNRMMDLIMAFLSTWAANYRAGVTREGEIMHRLGEMSDKMLGSLFDASKGKHHGV